MLPYVASRSKDQRAQQDHQQDQRRQVLQDQPVPRDGSLSLFANRDRTHPRLHNSLQLKETERKIGRITRRLFLQGFPRSQV